MMRKGAYLPAAMLATVGQSVMAQPATGTLIPNRESSAMVQGAIARTGEKQPRDTAIEGGRTMARCLVGNHPKEAEALLAADAMPAFEATYRRTKRFIASCLTMVEVYGDTAVIEMRYDFNTLRSLIAEARFRRFGVPRLPAATYEPKARGSEWISDDPATRATLQVADCLAARQPDAVADLLRTSPGASGEGAAFSALIPNIAGCLERNIRLSLKALGLRLALASAFDSRARQAALVPGSK